MENTNTIVKEEVITPLPSEGETEVPEVKPPKEDSPPSAGSKTDPNLLLKSLQDEREKRKGEQEANRLLQEELEKLKSSYLSEGEAFSDEGKLLQSKIDSVNKELSELKEETNLQAILAKYPVLKDKLEEFGEFRKTEHPKVKLESVAKIFLAENGLFEQPRKGLEQPTGGTRTPLTTGMTAEDVKTLRTTNYKKYMEMVRSGLIKFES